MCSSDLLNYTLHESECYVWYCKRSLKALWCNPGRYYPLVFTDLFLFEGNRDYIERKLSFNTSWFHCLLVCCFPLVRLLFFFWHLYLLNSVMRNYKVPQPLHYCNKLVSCLWMQLFFFINVWHGLCLKLLLKAACITTWSWIWVQKVKYYSTVLSILKWMQ